MGNLADYHSRAAQRAGWGVTKGPPQYPCGILGRASNRGPHKAKAHAWGGEAHNLASKWGRWDLNPRLPAYEAGELSRLLHSPTMTSNHSVASTGLFKSLSTMVSLWLCH